MGFGRGPTLLDVSFENPFDRIVTYDDLLLDLVTCELCLCSLLYTDPIFCDSTLIV